MLQYFIPQIKTFQGLFVMFRGNKQTDKPVQWFRVLLDQIRSLCCPCLLSVFILFCCFVSHSDFTELSVLELTKLGLASGPLQFPFPRPGIFPPDKYLASLRSLLKCCFPRMAFSDHPKEWAPPSLCPFLSLALSII